MKRYFFRKNQRLRTNRQFRQVLAHRRSAGNKFMRLYIAPDNQGPKFGVSVATSAGSAATRNRLKRLAREVFRQNQHNIPQRFDYLLIFAPKMSKKAKRPNSQNLKNLRFQDIEKDFMQFAAKLSEHSRE